MKKNTPIFLVFCLLVVFISARAQHKVTISGFVKDIETKEDLIGAIVQIKGIAKGVTTNAYGFYALNVSANDTIALMVSSLGYTPYLITFVADSINVKKDFFLSLQMKETKEVLVLGNKESQFVEATQMSKNEITIEEAKKIPPILGEVDIIKVLQMKPGIQSGGEGVTGIFVRGGGPDQNLILLDESTVYNANHLFGFFSIFNPDIVKGAEVYKGAFPAQYGGRLSSVIDVKLKEGNKNKFGASGGIGLITSRLTVEGPIQKGKSSFIISGRRTYIEPVIEYVNKQNVNDPNYEVIPNYYFYDLNAKINYELGKKDRVYASMYLGRDAFQYRTKSNFDFIWGNTVGTLRWNHVFGTKMFCNTSLYTTKYRYVIKQQFDSYDYKLASYINDVAFKTDFEYFPSNKHEVKFGAYFTQHNFSIGRLQSGTQDGSVNFEAGSVLGAQDFGVYLGDEFDLSSKWKVNAGLRLSGFRKKAEDNYYFMTPEPRFSLRYKLKPNISLKASYSRMMQYVHLVSNSGGTLPTDVWYPSNKYVNPESAHQVAIGPSASFKEGKYNVSYEFYYKRMYNQMDLRDGAQIFSNPKLEEEFVYGDGWAYGNEFFVEKKKGKITGWLSYTLSWNWRQFDQINRGEAFNPRYDQRHNINVVAMYELSKRFVLSLTWVYGSGNAVTLPQGRLMLQNVPGASVNIAIPEYMPRNSYRMEPYHRMDLAFIWKFAPRWGESDLTFAIYNMYNRANPYFIYFEPKSTTSAANYKFVAKQASLFPVIPTLTYNFKF